MTIEYRTLRTHSGCLKTSIGWRRCNTRKNRPITSSLAIACHQQFIVALLYKPIISPGPEWAPFLGGTLIPHLYVEIDFTVSLFGNIFFAGTTNTENAKKEPTLSAGNRLRYRPHSESEPDDHHMDAIRWTSKRSHHRPSQTSTLPVNVILGNDSVRLTCN